jgi:transposase InsO family protein
MKGYEIPDRPWQRVGLDLFELDSENFIVISDYYSKIFEIAKLPNTKSSTVISHLGPHFERYGIPDEIVSDNGSQFASSEFQKYTTRNNIRHTTLSPIYPQSNGLPERTVQTAKKLLKKPSTRKTILTWYCSTSEIPQLKELTCLQHRC